MNHDAIIEVTAAVLRCHKFESWNHSLANGFDPLDSATVEDL